MIAFTGTIAAVAWYMVVLPVFGIIVVVVGIGLVRDMKRTAGLKALAAQLGFNYYSRSTGILALYPSLDLFNLGIAHRVTNNMRGEIGQLTVRMFDYECDRTRANGEKEFWCTLSAVLIELPESFDEVAVTPRRSFHFPKQADEDSRVASFGDDFDARYTVTACDEKFARTVLNSESIRLIKKYADMHLEVAGTAVLFHRDRKLSADKLSKLLTMALEFLKCVPALELTKHADPAAK